MIGVRSAILLALALAVIFVFSARVDSSHYSWLGHGADVPADSALLGQFAPTFYRILDEATTESAPGQRTETLLTLKGRVIARVTPDFRRALDVEGSARLRDGRIVNIEERVGGQYRYLVVHNAPFGIGAPGYKLIPYRTLAVDPRRIKLGTVLYVPALAGIVLPSGEMHDGFCFAHDTGHGIIGSRIDIFVGFEGDRDNALTRSGRMVSYEPIRVYRVDGTTAKKVNERFAASFVSNE